MRESYVITTPFVTPEETARVLGVEPKRARKLIAMVKENLEKKGYAATVDGRHFVPHMKGTGNSQRPQPSEVKVHAKTRIHKSRSASRRKLTRGKAKSSH